MKSTLFDNNDLKTSLFFITHSLIKRSLFIVALKHEGSGTTVPQMYSLTPTSSLAKNKIQFLLITCRQLERKKWRHFHNKYCKLQQTLQTLHLLIKLIVT